MIKSANANGVTTTDTYDTAGNLSEIDAGNGTVTTYGYNSAENPNSIATAKSGVTQFSFDASGTGGIAPDGNVQKMTTTQAASYDLTPGNSTTAGTDSFQSNPMGELLKDKQTGSGAASTTYAYNDNAEPATEDNSTGNNGVHYATSGSDSGPITSVTTTTHMMWTATTYGADGNRTCEGDSTPCATDPYRTTFGYNGADRLYALGYATSTPSCAGGPVPPSSYECITYDGNGEAESLDYTAPAGSDDSLQTLTWSTADGSPWLATYDYQDTTSGAEHHTDFIPGPDGTPVEQINIGTATTAAWYYYDLSGNTRALLDYSGSVSATYNYDVYGNMTPGATSSEPGTPLLFQGEFTDQYDSGLVFMQARWYDPMSGEFMTQDPMVDQTLQPYAYAGDDPTKDAPAYPKCKFPKGNNKPLWTWCQPDSTVWRNGNGDPKKSQAWLSSDVESRDSARPHYNLVVARAGSADREADKLLNFHCYYCGRDIVGSFVWADSDSDHPGHRIPDTVIGKTDLDPNATAAVAFAYPDYSTQMVDHIRPWLRHFAWRDFQSSVKPALVIVLKNLVQFPVKDPTAKPCQIIPYGGFD